MHLEDACWLEQWTDVLKVQWYVIKMLKPPKETFAGFSTKMMYLGYRYGKDE